VVSAQQASPPPRAPVAAPPKAAPPPAALPSAKRCVSRRRFRIRLRQDRADPLVRAEVYIGRRRMRVVTGARLRADVDLRGLPAGKVVVRVVGRTRSGATSEATRTYRTCAARRR
jgi:hypothetical protein